MGKAIVIGCSQYDDPEIGTLQFAHVDALAFAESLTNYCGLAKHDIELLSTPGAKPATRANIARSIHELGCSSDDIVFFFFSGHGFKSAKDGKDYLLPQDSLFADLEFNSVHLDHIVAEISKSGARCAVLVIDACRNFVRGGKSTDTEQLLPIDPSCLNIKGMAAFFSCCPSERSYEAPAISSGIFTRALLDALSDQGRCRTVRELDAYLNRRVPELGRTYSRPEQRPLVRIEPLSMADVRVVSRERMIDLGTHHRLGRECRRKVLLLETEQRYKVLTDIASIDFGSSYSLLAFPTHDGEVVFIGETDGTRHIPTKILVLPNMDFIVGRAALESAAFSNGSLIENFKRLIPFDVMLCAHGQDFQASEFATVIIGSMIKNAEEALGREIQNVLAAVPASFSLLARDKVAEAFERSGIRLIRFISEPCAAAICGFYNGNSEPFEMTNGMSAEIVLVIDIGGGTSDIATVEVCKFDDAEVNIEVISVHGNHEVGGQDFDEVLRKLMLQRVQEIAATQDITIDHRAERQLLAEAERVKIRLGTTTEAQVVLSNLEGPEGLADLEITIHRDELVSASNHLIENIKLCVESAVSEVVGRYGKEGLRGWNAVDTVMLAGQGCKIWPIKQFISSITQGRRVIFKYQEAAVAIGLARYAAVLNGNNKKLLLLDVLPTTVTLAYSREERAKNLTNYAISSDMNANNRQLRLLSAGSSIPTKQNINLALIGPEHTYEIVLNETHVDGELTELARIELIADGSMKAIELILRVDADMSVVLILQSGDNPNQKSLKYLVCGRFSRAGREMLLDKDVVDIRSVA